VQHAPTTLSVGRARPVIRIMWQGEYLETYTGTTWQTSADPRWLDVEPTVWLFEDSTPRREDWFVDILLRLRWTELAHGS
jgi:hypothetical protein